MPLAHFTNIGRSIEGNFERVKDYKGNIILMRDSVWREVENKWCHKDEAIWINVDHYAHKGYWTIPKEMEETVSIKWFKKGKLENDE